MGPFVMKYWSVDEVMLFFEFLDVVVIAAATPSPALKADEMTSRKIVNVDMVLVKFILSEMLVEGIFFPFLFLYETLLLLLSSCYFCFCLIVDFMSL